MTKKQNKQVRKRCATCGKSFVTRKSDRRFCSDNCRVKHAQNGTGLYGLISLSERNELLKTMKMEYPGLITIQMTEKEAQKLCDKHDIGKHNKINHKQKTNYRIVHGYIYLLQSPTSAYKIGRTKDPTNRLKTFGVKLPFEVEYAALIKTPDMVGLEHELHHKFAEKRINGEWFDLSAQDVEYIKGLQS